MTSAPRDVFELVDIVAPEDDVQVEQIVKKSMWTNAFLESPKLKCSRQKIEIFYFLVYLSQLNKIPENDIDRTKHILERIKVRYFSDSEYWQPSIAFRDIHNVVEHIFRLVNIHHSKNQKSPN